MIAFHVLVATIGALLAVCPINATSPDPTLAPADADLASTSGGVPSPQIGGRLKQTTRSEVLIRQARRRLRARDSVPSGGTTNVCTVSSTSANPSLRGAVFHNVSTDDVSTVSGFLPTHHSNANDAEQIESPLGGRRFRIERYSDLRGFLSQQHG